MKRLMLALVIGIPLASVASGGVLLYFALNSNDVNVFEDAKALSKTSWHEEDKTQP